MQSIKRFLPWGEGGKFGRYIRLLERFISTKRGGGVKIRGLLNEEDQGVQASNQACGSTLTRNKEDPK